MVKLNTAITLLLMAIVPLMSGCKKDKEDNFVDNDDQIIQDYIAAHNLVAEKTESGIYYIIDEPGSDKHPNIKSDVRVTYSGYYTDEVLFDEGGTHTFSLQNVIKGWQEGIPLFGKGGRGILLIPSKLGYGSKPSGSMRKNAVLIFDIHLIDFV